MSEERMDEQLRRLNENLNQELSGDKGSLSGSHRSSVSGKAGRKRFRLTPFRVFVGILLFLLLLALVGAGAVLVMRAQGEQQLKKSQTTEKIEGPQKAAVEEDGQTVVYENKRYRYNEDIITLLFMGIDKSMGETGADQIGEKGQADSLFLAAMDKHTGKISLIALSRDSMADVNLFNVEGNYLGVEKMQICLAYAYGDGGEESCKNTATAVSRLLYGMPIHSYAAIDLDALEILNDMVGGVTVKVLEDLTGSDPALVKGEKVTLDGQQANTYVRSRQMEKLDSNNLRMQRQKQYLMAFLKKAMKQTAQDVSTLPALYGALDGYMVTDITLQEVTYLGTLALQKGFSGVTFYSVPGEVVQGERYAEFIPDEEALYEMILEIFYE